MDFDRLKKMSGLTESDNLSAELQRAKVERTVETDDKPKFAGLLSASVDDNNDGFSFLKSLKKPIDEAGDDEINQAAEDRRWHKAKEAFEDDFNIGYVETEEGANEIFGGFFLQHIHDGMVDAAEETNTLEKWALAVASAWEDFRDAVLSDRGGNSYWSEDGGRDHEYDYFDMKIDRDFQKYYSKEFAKWASSHQDVLTSKGFSEFPDANPVDFSKMVASHLDESIVEAESCEDDHKDIETINESLYNQIQSINANSNILDQGIMVGYVMEQLNISKTPKNIALVESVIYKK